jgi:sarcosine oxidase subunit delta
MLLIACPHCGPRAQVEFVYERTLDSIVTLEMSVEDAMGALFTRTNPRGPSRELWRHTHGCRSWLVLDRHTGTHEIASVRAWETSEP